MKLIKQSAGGACPGCGSGFVVSTYQSEPGDKKTLSEVCEVYPKDGQGRTWCPPCWNSPTGKKERRLDKLEALAANEGASVHERALARQRAMEILALRAFDPNIRASREKNDRLEKTKREQRCCQASIGITMFAVVLAYAGAHFQHTGTFWGTLSIGFTFVGSWYSWHPVDRAAPVYRALLMALYFSTMTWYWEPLEKIMTSGMGTV